MLKKSHHHTPIHTHPHKDHKKEAHDEVEVKDEVDVKEEAVKSVYTTPEHQVFFSIAKLNDQYVLESQCDSKITYSDPDTLEGILKMLAAKASYFAQLIDAAHITSIPDKKFYTPSDEREIQRLQRAAEKAGEHFDDSQFLSSKTTPKPVTKAAVPSESVTVN